MQLTKMTDGLDGEFNDGLLESCEKKPVRFQPFCVLFPSTGILLWSTQRALDNDQKQVTAAVLTMSTMISMNPMITQRRFKPLGAAAVPS